jgi:hypothetical protein
LPYTSAEEDKDDKDVDVESGASDEHTDAGNCGESTGEYGFVDGKAHRGLAFCSRLGEVVDFKSSELISSYM